MPDDTNELLRQILDTQRQLLAAYHKEMERTADFRIAALEMQRMAQRRAIIVAIAVAIGIALILIPVVASKF